MSTVSTGEQLKKFKTLTKFYFPNCQGENIRKTPITKQSRIFLVDLRWSVEMAWIQRRIFRPSKNLQQGQVLCMLYWTSVTSTEKADNNFKILVLTIGFSIFPNNYCWKDLPTDSSEMSTNHNAAMAGNGKFFTYQLFSAFLVRS